jgi:Leucine-rich repeat (LRR) protein
VCIPQYRRGFERLWRGASMLNYSRCGWGDADAEELAGALEWAHAQGIDTPAYSLRMGANALTDEALPRLVAALQAGAMPELNNLALEDNKLTDAGLETLRPLLAGRLSKQLTRFAYGRGMTGAGMSTLVALLADGHLVNLEELDLSNNELSDAGAQALAAALSAGQLPKLKELRVNGNAIGDAGAEALAAAVRGGGGASLRKLVVGENAFGDASTRALRAACAARGVAAHASYFDVL